MLNIKSNVSWTIKIITIAFVTNIIDSAFSAFNEFLGGLEQLREIKLSDDLPRVSGGKNTASGE